MGDAMLLDEMQKFFRVEMLHDDERAPEPYRAGGADQRRRMVERGRHEIGHAFAEPPLFRDSGEQTGCGCAGG